nr:unnamed protein product [Camelus bactrianus]
MPGPLPESRLGLPLSGSLTAGLQEKQRSSSSGRVFKKYPSFAHLQVPCSVWPARCSQRLAPSGPTVSADLSPRAPGSSASGFAIQAASRADGAVTRTPNGTNLGRGLAEIGRQLAGARGRLRRGGRTPQGAQRWARGTRRAAPSTPWTGRAITAPCPPSNLPRGRHAALPRAVFFLECPPRHLKTRFSRDASASLHLAPG